MRYVVLVRTPGRVEVEIRGPYRSFKRAKGDAKAWSEAEGFSASVEPVLPIDQPSMLLAVYIDRVTHLK